MDRFQQIVAAFGVTVRVRREMGQDIFGACGQLALTQPRLDADVKNSKIVDLEDDFMVWRRKRPEEEKKTVSLECVALAAASGATGHYIDLMMPHDAPDGKQTKRGYSSLALAGPDTALATIAAMGAGAVLYFAFVGHQRLRAARAF